MRACEGSLLLVDATQGVEAQTLANAYQAIDADHEIVPVLNKIDLPAAEPERIQQQIEDIIGLDANDALLISAKTGLGRRGRAGGDRPAPAAAQGEADAPLKALVVDSWYDPYLGVVILVRVKNGALGKGQKIRMMGTGAVYQVDRVGVLTPKPLLLDQPLGPGEIGFITASIKDIADARVGDTITDDRKPGRGTAAGLPAVQPVVFCGMYPDRCRRVRGSARQRSASCGSTTPASSTSPRALERARPRLPLRLSRPAPPRDHPGAPDARVRPRPRHHRALGGLPGASDRRQRAGAAQPRRHARPDPDRPRRGALDQGHDPGARRVSGPDARALHREARLQQGADLCRQARDAGLPPAAQRGGLRLLRPPEVDQPRLCQLRLPARRLWRERPGQARRADQRRPRSIRSP